MNFLNFVKKNKLATLLLAMGLLLSGFAFMTVKQTQPAPDLSFKNIKGEPLSMSSLRGRPVLVNFWATSCTTCIKEMPDMVKTYERFQSKGLAFLAIAMAYDPPNYVLNFVESRALPFQVVLDVDGRLAKGFGDVKLTPTTFLIDRQGQIIRRYVGIPDFEELHRLLDTM